MPEVYICIPSLEGGHLEHEVIQHDRSSGEPYRLIMFKDDHVPPQMLPEKLNRMWKWALEDPECKYIVSQSNDHHVQTDGWLYRLVSKMRQEPDIGCLSPIQMNNYRGTKPWGQFFPDKSGYTDTSDSNWVKEDDPRWGTVDINYDDFSRGLCIIRRELLEKIGFNDLNYGYGSIDNADMALRTIAAGYRSVLWGGAYFRHAYEENADNIWVKKIYGSTTYPGMYDEYHRKKWGRFVGMRPLELYALAKRGELKPAFEGRIRE